MAAPSPTPTFAQQVAKWRSASTRLRATRGAGRDGQQDEYEANVKADLIDAILNDLAPLPASPKDHT